MSFSFGTPSSAPASSGLTGFNFGANKPATPGLGLAAPTQPATGFFGSPATSTSAFGTTPAFGAPTANTSFGAPAANTSFGGINPTPAQNPPPAFGATGTPSFGAATTGFGATSVAPFGSTTTPSFGATTTPGFGAAATSFGTTPAFGTTTTPSFGTTPVPSFGANTSVPTLGSSLGTGGLNFGPGTNTTQSSAGFFAPPASTSAGLGGLGGFNFGKTATTTQSSFNKPIGFGATTTVSSALPATTATPSFGLGGAGGIASSAGIGANTATNDGKEEPPKQTKLPNEISTTVDSFKEFVKKQKSLSSDIMRVSIKPLNKVSRDVDVLMRQTLSLQTKVWSCRAHARRLRSAAASALTAADTPYAPSDGDLEGACPPAYVVQLIEELEAQLATFRRQMDVADKQLQAEPKLLTEQEITLGIRRMHESLVALAGRLQAVHTQVEAQKEQYLNLRKYVLKDPTNVFEIPTANSSLDQILRDTETSRKKSKTGLSDVNVSSAVLSDPKAALGNIQQLAGPTPFSYIANTLSPFPNTDSNTNWQPPQPQPAAAPPTLATPLMTGFTDPGTLQLQKPPGKRGKQ